MFIKAWLAISTVQLFALISPGPDFALIIRHCTHYSRRVSLWCAAGLAAGVACHALYSLIGLSWLINNHPKFFLVIQFISAAYLGYLGYGALKSAFLFKNDSVILKNKIMQETKISILPKRLAFKKGLFTNLLNPKAIIYFISIFTALVLPLENYIFSFIAGFTVSIMTFIWFALLACFFTGKKAQKFLQEKAKIMDIIVGVIFIGFAITIFYTALY